MFQSQQYGRMSIADQDSNTDGPHEFHRASLYILGDKTQMKVINIIFYDNNVYFSASSFILIIFKGHER